MEDEVMGPMTEKISKCIDNCTQKCYEAGSSIGGVAIILLIVFLLCCCSSSLISAYYAYYYYQQKNQTVVK